MRKYDDNRTMDILKKTAAVGGLIPLAIFMVLSFGLLAILSLQMVVCSLLTIIKILFWHIKSK